MTHRTSLRSLRNSKLLASVALLGGLVVLSSGLAGCDVGGDLSGDEDRVVDESSSPGTPSHVARPRTETRAERGAPPCIGDCGKGDVGFAAKSCADLLYVNPKAPSGVYRISPPGVSKPFEVYCDMTTDGGGWTALPLRFADKAFWSIERSGADCVEVTEVANDGSYSQHQTTRIEGFADTAFEFVPGVEVSEVRFVGLGVATSGGVNTMDFAIGEVSTANYMESWWFADADPSVARGFVFGEEACPAPFVATPGKAAHCTLDATPTADLIELERRVAYDEAAPIFQTVVRESCKSNLPDPIEAGETFALRTPPDADGIWRSGIFVR